jgi:hypothetical protein
MSEEKLSPTVNVDSPEKKKGGKGKIFLIALVVIIGLVIIGSALGNGGKGSSGSSNASGSSSTDTKAANDFGGDCMIIKTYINEALQVMGGAGTTTTVEDIVPVLKDRGSLLSQGFAPEDVGGAENAALLKDAGQALLEIRVALLSNNDIAAPADKFSADSKKILAICKAAGQ